MALKFLGTKSWNPTNKANQKKLFIAEQKAKDDAKRQLEAQRAFEMEQELYQNRQIVQNQSKSFHERKMQVAKGKGKKVKESDDGPAPQPLNFMYAAPPGLKAALEKEGKGKSTLGVGAFVSRDDDELFPDQHKRAAATTSNATEPARPMFMVIKPGQDIAKAYAEFSQLAGTTTQLPKSNDSDEPDQQQDQSGDAVPSAHGPVGPALPTEEQLVKKQLTPAEKFPFLKNAPVEGSYTENVAVHHRPFGIQVRNVKCVRCGQFGHTSGDRECPLKDFNALDVRRRIVEDPMTLIAERENALRSSSKLNIKPLGPKLNAQDSNQKMILSDEEEEQQSEKKYDPLAMLSKSEKKRLHREYKQMLKKYRNEADGSSSSDSSDDSDSSSTSRKRKRKSKKHKKDKKERSSKKKKRDRSRSRSRSRDRGEADRSRHRSRSRSRSRSRDRSEADRSRRRDRTPERSPRDSAPSSSSKSQRSRSRRSRSRSRDRSPDRSRDRRRDRSRERSPDRSRDRRRDRSRERSREPKRRRD